MPKYLERLDKIERKALESQIGERDKIWLKQSYMESHIKQLQE